jgi:hypothetical protein
MRQHILVGMLSGRSLPLMAASETKEEKEAVVLTYPFGEKLHVPEDLSLEPTSKGLPSLSNNTAWGGL